MRTSVICLLVVVAGCQNEMSKETFEGKTGTEWMKLSEDADVKTRAHAAVALSKMKATAAHARIKAMLNDPEPSVQVSALEGRKFATSEEIIAALTSVARKSGISQVRIPKDAINYLQYDIYAAAVKEQGSRAKSLLPELKRIRKEIADFDGEPNNKPWNEYSSSWQMEIMWVDDLIEMITK